MEIFVDFVTLIGNKISVAFSLSLLTSIANHIDKDPRSIYRCPIQ